MTDGALASSHPIAVPRTVRRLTAQQRILKRTTDIIVSLLSLALVAPLVPFICLAIWLESPAHTLFKQERVGLDGRSFMVLKFRTMVPNAERLTGPVLATDHDPRLTRVGAFLRAYRLDELPQLINVLRGEMSIVGPRPERPVFVEDFSERLELYSLRHAVKPGITGLAQISGGYSLPVEEKLGHDLTYIRSYSYLLDIAIMCRTVRVVLDPEYAKGVSDKERVS